MQTSVIAAIAEGVKHQCEVDGRLPTGTTFDVGYTVDQETREELAKPEYGASSGATSVEHCYHVPR